MFAEAQTAIGPLGVFVANARPDVQHFYQPVLDLTAEHWRSAIDSQATALLLAAREAAGMMVERGGRIVVVTYAGWLDWKLAVVGRYGTSEGGDGISLAISRLGVCRTRYHGQRREPRSRRR